MCILAAARIAACVLERAMPRSAVWRLLKHESAKPRGEDINARVRAEAESGPLMDNPGS